MDTVFENLDANDAALFHHYYEKQFLQWAIEYRKRGKSQAIVFDILPGEPAILDANGQLPWRGAWMTAELGVHRGERAMIVKPATDQDREAIEMHCWKLKRQMLA